MSTEQYVDTGCTAYNYTNNIIKMINSGIILIFILLLTISSTCIYFTIQSPSTNLYILSSIFSTILISCTIFYIKNLRYGIDSLKPVNPGTC